MPNPGEYRQRVTIQRQTTASDSIGAPKQGAWTTAFAVWARVDPAYQPQEYMPRNSPAIVATATYWIYTRPLASDQSISVKDRAVWNGIVLDIQTVQPNNRGNEIKILAKEIQS